MGIKAVNATVEKISPRAFTQVKVSRLKNKFIAVDTALWLYANMSTATKQVVTYMKDLLEDIDRRELIKKCLESALKFHTYMLDNDIHLIWIRDGQTPKEKTATRAKRKENRDDKASKIEELKKELNETDILLRNKNGKMDELRKLLQYHVIIYKEEFEIFYNTLQGFGIPLIDAPSEAEALGCSMNREGIVYGLWTTDTDCYALGGINMITSFGGRDEDEDDVFNVTHIPYILKDMEFNQDEMKDFCIMCGTDFNDNIPNIGGGRALKHIEKHRNIEEFEKNTDKDCSILNYERVRELLTPPECEFDFDSPELRLSAERFSETAQDLSIEYGLYDYYLKLGEYMESNINVTKYNIKSGPHNKRSGPRIVISNAKNSPASTNPKPKKVVREEIEDDEQVSNLAQLLNKLNTKKEENNNISNISSNNNNNNNNNQEKEEKNNNNNQEKEERNNDNQEKEEKKIKITIKVSKPKVETLE